MCFVFFFIGIVGFFPDTAYYYGSARLYREASPLFCWQSAAPFMRLKITAPKKTLCICFIRGHRFADSGFLVGRINAFRRRFYCG